MTPNCTKQKDQPQVEPKTQARQQTNPDECKPLIEVRPQKSVADEREDAAGEGRPLKQRQRERVLQLRLEDLIESFHCRVHHRHHL